MPDNAVNDSPIDADESSIAFDPAKREIVLEQAPGEQPVTIGGGALGPKVTPDGAVRPVDDGGETSTS